MQAVNTTVVKRATEQKIIDGQEEDYEIVDDRY